MISLLTIVLLCFYHLLHSSQEVSFFEKEKTYALRGVLALLIVLCHCSFVNKNELIDISEFQYVGSWVCGIFFMLSGYGLYMQKEKIIEESFNHYAKRRIVPLVNDLVIITLLFNIIALIFEYLSLEKIVEHLSKFDLNNILPYSWFIYVLIGLYTITYYTSRVNQGEVTLTLFCCLCVVVMWYLKFDICWYNSLLSYPIGHLVAKYRQFIENRIGIIGGGICVINLISCILRNMYIDFLITPLLAFAIILLSGCLPMAGYMKIKPISKYSLYIYMLQGIAIKVICPKMAEGNETIYIVSAILFSVLLGYTYFKVKVFIKNIYENG